MLSSLGNQSCLSVNTWNLNLHHQAFIEHLLNGSVTGLVLQETDSDQDSSAGRSLGSALGQPCGWEEESERDEEEVELCYRSKQSVGCSRA